MMMQALTIAERPYLPTVLALLGQQRALDDLLDSELAEAVSPILALLRTQVAIPLARCTTQEEVAAAMARVRPRLSDLLLALGSLVLREMPGSPEEAVSELQSRMRQVAAEIAEEVARRTDDAAGGRTLVALGAVTRHLWTAAQHPTDDAMEALLGFFGAMVALVVPEAVAPRVLASYAHRQAMTFARATKMAQGSARTSPTPRGDATSDPEDVARAANALRAWLVDSELGREPYAR